MSVSSDVSPCVGIKLPKATRAEPRFLSPEELVGLADAVPDRYRALVLVGGYGALRFGELVGLTLPVSTSCAPTSIAVYCHTTPLWSA